VKSDEVRKILGNDMRISLSTVRSIREVEKILRKRRCKDAIINK
jgi:hypothetical protein